MKEIVIFCDGACLGNPGPGAAGWILKVGDHIHEGGEAHESTTNNRMELLALLKPLEQLDSLDFKSLKIFSDSKYVLNGLQSWISGWKRRGWLTAEGEPVKNRDLWEFLDQELTRFTRSKVSFHYTPGHQGIPGNERCDEIASTLAKGEKVELFDGPLHSYSVDLTVTTRQTFDAPIYLSYVGGKIHRDKTWKECEARVKGGRGAKYKKVKSVEEEAATLAIWGVSHLK